MAEQTSRNHNRFSFSIRAKLLVAFVGLALGPMALLAGWMFWQAEGVLRHQLEHELEIEVATAANALELQLEGIGREVLSLERFLSRRLRPYMSESQWQTVEEEFLDTIEQGPFYFQVRYIGRDGMENIRVNNDQGTFTLVPPEQLQYKGERYYFKEALAAELGQLYISRLDFNVEYGRVEEPKRLVVRLGTPVRGAFNRKRGVVILNVFGAELLAPLEKLETGLGGEVLLASGDNRFVEMRQTESGSVFHAGTAEEFTHLLEGAEGILRAERTIQVAPGQQWRLIKLLPQSVLREALWQGQKNILWLLIPMTAFVALLAVLAARSFSQPIRKLSGMAEALAGGDYGKRASVLSRDEFGALGQSLNEMAEALEMSHKRLQRWNEDLQHEVDLQVEALKASQAETEASRAALAGLEKQLLQADRLASLGMLAATIAHEVGNPLAGLKLRLQMLQRKMSPEQAETADLDRLLEMVDRLGGFVDHLTGYVVSGRKRIPGPADVGAVLQDIDFLLREEAERKGAELALNLPEGSVRVCSQGQHLHQIFMNLILNAVQAVPDGGRVQVEVDKMDDQVRVRVLDNGPGLSEELLEKAFDPLFTTKEDGTGLGLPIVLQLIEELGGEFNLGNRLDGGAVAEVRLPRREGTCPDEF